MAADDVGPNRKVYEAPRIHAELIEAGVHAARKRLARLMRRSTPITCTALSTRRKSQIATLVDLQMTVDVRAKMLCPSLRHNTVWF